MSRRQRFRRWLVLGPVLRYLHGGERIHAWTHARVPKVRAPAVLVVTNYHVILHIASSRLEDFWAPLSRLSSFELEQKDPEYVRVHLRGEGHEVDVELALSNRRRSRSVGRVLSALIMHEVAGPDSFDAELTSPVPPMVRGMRHHARRVWITTAGVLVLLLGVVFASPFVPGPGALTFVAGIAILAREYEWARDLHVWSARQVERFIAWLRQLRRRRATSSREAGEP